MATTKGQDFINKYKDTDCLKSSWEMVYKKGHITLDEFAECASLTEAEIQQWKDGNKVEPQPNEIDILKAELLDANKVILDLQLQILTQSI